MTVAVDQSFRRHRLGRTSVINDGTVVAARPLGVSVVGLVTVLLGAWAGIAVYVGPLFGYKPTTTGAWTWTTNNWLLHLIPGAVAVAAGFVLLFDRPSRRAGTRGMVSLASLLVICAGIWLVIGPDVWSLTHSSLPLRLAATTNMGFLIRIGANLGPGVLLAALGGMALRAGIALPAVELVSAPSAAPATAVEEVPVPTSAGAVPPVAESGITQTGITQTGITQTGSLLGPGDAPVGEAYQAGPEEPPTSAV